MNAAQRAELYLEATTKLSIEQCFTLITAAARITKPGATYAGQGLALQVIGIPEAAVIMMTSNVGAVCDFALQAKTAGAKTHLRMGGLAHYNTIRHTIWWIPVGTEIRGYGYYKRYLGQVGGAIERADPLARVLVATPWG